MKLGLWDEDEEWSGRTRELRGQGTSTGIRDDVQFDGRGNDAMERALNRFWNQATSTLAILPDMVRNGPGLRSCSLSCKTVKTKHAKGSRGYGWRNEGSRFDELKRGPSISCDPTRLTQLTKTAQ